MSQCIKCLINMEASKELGSKNIKNMTPNRYYGYVCIKRYCLLYCFIDLRIIYNSGICLNSLHDKQLTEVFHLSFCPYVTINTTVSI